MYAFPHVCPESQFLRGQDFDPLQEISQIDGGRLRQLGVLAVIENVLEADEQGVVLIERGKRGKSLLFTLRLKDVVGD